MSNVPSEGDILTDMTFSVTFPSSSNVSISATTASSLINKSGVITVHPTIDGRSVQQFAVKPGSDGNGSPLPSSMLFNVPYEIGRVTATVGNPQVGDEALLAAVNEIASNQPNIGINLNDQITTISGFAPLPITLKSFDAKKHSASSVKLDWTTSKEVNSDYFGIERSQDGSTWDEIARVKAAGDSNVDLAYDYIDDKLPLSRTSGQVFYYRLRMTDLDGAFKYSDIRGVNFDNRKLGPISIYPNPTTEIVNIDLSEVVMENGDVTVSVYDMSGRLVMTKNIIGSGIELIKVDQLPSDAYNFIIRQGEQIHQQRIIKID